MPDRLRRKIEALLEEAGLRLDGDGNANLSVHDERFYRRVLAHGSIGLGESYMNGWWDCDRLDEFFHRILAARLNERVRGHFDVFDWLRARFFNLQTDRRAFQVGKRHYDIGNELYRRMLDRRMIYSCALWAEGDDLDTAQERKLEMCARKLYLQPGMRVLDIGCGWGGTAQYLAERHGVEVVGITVSEEQARLAREICAGLPVDIRLQDYREVEGRFDRVISIGMFEHVGHRNYGIFMGTVHRVLEPGGLCLLHTIGTHRSQFRTDPWIAKYIFPNSMAPSMAQIAGACEGRLAIEDVHNIGPNYDPTLMAWRTNVVRHRGELSEWYDERFFRMWDYYLLSCAGTFRAGRNPVWQLVLSPGRARPGGYQRPPLPL
jgi:cyclopropane-fatty-acyl-phospholipid synthase